MPSIEYLTKNRSLGLPNGPYDLDKESIERVVKSRKAGNFAIGYIAPIGGFAPKMIGGSDEDLRQGIMNKIETAHQRGYDKFCFKYTKSVKERFEIECFNFHNFHRQLDHKKHPYSPDGTNYSCPDKICAQFFNSGRNTLPKEHT